MERELGDTSVHLVEGVSPNYETNLDLEVRVFDISGAVPTAILEEINLFQLTGHTFHVRYPMYRRDSALNICREMYICIYTYVLNK